MSCLSCAGCRCQVSAEQSAESSARAARVPPAGSSALSLNPRPVTSIRGSQLAGFFNKKAPPAKPSEKRSQAVVHSVSSRASFPSASTSIAALNAAWEKEQEAAVVHSRRDAAITAGLQRFGLARGHATSDNNDCLLDCIWQGTSVALQRGQSYEHLRGRFFAFVKAQIGVSRDARLSMNSAAEGPAILRACRAFFVDQTIFPGHALLLNFDINLLLADHDGEIGTVSDVSQITKQHTREDARTVFLNIIFVHYNHYEPVSEVACLAAPLSSSSAWLSSPLASSGPLARVPQDLIPANDEELRRLYQWEVFDVQSAIVVGGASTKLPVHVRPSPIRPAEPGLSLWLLILSHIAEHYRYDMSSAMLMQWYSFFFAVLPCHKQLKDGRGLKNKLGHCSLCLSPLVAPFVLADSHWIPQSFWYLMMGDKTNRAGVKVLQPNTAPMPASAVTLPLFCTLPEAASKEQRITCEKTRLNDGGEKAGVPALKDAIYDLIAAGPDGDFTLKLTPQLHNLLVSIGVMLVACDDPAAEAQWSSPHGLFTPDTRAKLWRFFLMLREFTLQVSAPRPKFSIHLLVHPDARSPPAHPQGLLLYHAASRLLFSGCTPACARDEDDQRPDRSVFLPWNFDACKLVRAGMEWTPSS